MQQIIFYCEKIKKYRKCPAMQINAKIDAANIEVNPFETSLQKLKCDNLTFNLLLLA